MIGKKKIIGLCISAVHTGFKSDFVRMLNEEIVRENFKLIRAHPAYTISSTMIFLTALLFLTGDLRINRAVPNLYQRPGKRMFR